MTQSLPIFRREPPRTRTSTVEWLPPASSKDKPIVSIGDSMAYATPVFGLDLKVGDLVSVTRIGQTLRIDSIISRPATTASTTTTSTP